MPRLIFDSCNMSSWTILKLGGSILSSKNTIESERKVLFNYDFALEFLKSIEKWQKENLVKNLAIIVGGGTLNKQYLESTLKYLKDKKLAIDNISNDLKDYIGIASIALNAHSFLVLATSYFGKESVYQDVVKYKDYDRLEDFSPKANQPMAGKIGKNIKILIGGGHKPGFSSDLDAINLARFLNATKVVSLKNVDGVYDKDPNKHSDARYFKDLTWDEYKEILGDANYEPRSHFPIDVIATKEAAENSLEFVVMDGRDITNFEKYLRNEEFRGTVVR